MATRAGVNLFVAKGEKHGARGSNQKRQTTSLVYRWLSIGREHYVNMLFSAVLSGAVDMSKPAWFVCLHLQLTSTIRKNRICKGNIHI